MGAAGDGSKVNTGLVVCVLQNGVKGFTHLTVYFVIYLVWSVVRIKAKWQDDVTIIICNNTVNHSRIGLMHSTLLKLDG